MLRKLFALVDLAAVATANNSLSTYKIWFDRNTVTTHDLTPLHFMYPFIG